MKLNLIPIALLLSLAVGASTASAQLIAAKDAPIAYGHHHLNVTSVAEQKKFFADTLGGVHVTVAGRENRQESKDQKVPVIANHLHFFGQQNEEMQAWYVKVFDAKPGAPGGLFPSANLPGVGLAFSSSPTPTVGTQGRVVDHIGFEMHDLPAFLKKVEAMGIKPVNVRQVPELNVSIAFITDPWGTYIELTDVLRNIQ